MVDLVSGALLLLGSILVLLAGAGVLRLPDLYARMHAATKASTLGIALVGIAAAVDLGQERGKILVAITFIFVTAPSAAHFIGRAAYRAEGVEADLTERDDLRAMIDEIDGHREPGPSGTGELPG